MIAVRYFSVGFRRPRSGERHPGASSGFKFIRTSAGSRLEAAPTKLLPLSRSREPPMELHQRPGSSFHSSLCNCI
jgi:hypothetical protein